MPEPWLALGGRPAAIAAYMQAASRNRRIAGHEVGSGSGLHAAWLRSVRDMTAPLPGILQDAESDLQTAQSESDPHRLGQYARAAADAAAEVAMNDGASAQDRERALVIMRSSLALIPGSLLGEAQRMLAAARGEADPQRRRELARSALAKGREALGHRGVTDEERAQGRQVIGGARMIVNTIVETAMRQQAADREREHHTPSISL